MGYDAWLDRPLEDRVLWEEKCERAQEEIEAMSLDEIIDMIGEEMSKETLLDKHMDDLVETRASGEDRYC